MTKLVIAATAMIALGYPGEVASDGSTRFLWGALSTIPFTYILYVLWGQLNRAAEKNSAYVKVLLRNTRLLLLGTWGFYPIAFVLPLLGAAEGAATQVGLQVGYSIADIAAKCGYGVMIYAIAKAKMAAESELAEREEPAMLGHLAAAE